VTGKTVWVVDADAISSAAAVETLGAMGLDSVVCRSAMVFWDQFDPTQPGCVLLEVRIPGMNGLQVQQELLARRAPQPVVFLTHCATVSMAVRAMQAGAVHFLEKPFRENELRQAVSEALALEQQRRKAVATEERIRQRMAQLDQVERGLAQRILAGKSNRQIAEEVGVCVRTVELRRSRMMKKLQVNSVSQLAQLCWAMDSGSARHDAPTARRRIPLPIWLSPSQAANR
jgi:FixJ family two-component response regulator